TFELRLSVTTTLRRHQTIEAYVLKNNEVVFGDIGYNYTTITYNTNKSKGTANYGSYQSTGTGSGGSTSRVSSVCGAKNKTGGYCKRKVSGGGRCWQHR